MADAGIQRDDLRAAVASGILDEAQAARLLTLSDQRQGYRANMVGDDEPFELFKGFAEIFVTVGLGLLMAAVIGLMAIFGEGAAIPFVAAAISVALAWYFTLRRRMALPSIALCVAFAGCISFVVSVFVIQDKAEPQPVQIMVIGIISMILMLGYFRVFRLPFSMFIAAVFGLVALLGLAGVSDPSFGNLVLRPLDFFDLRRAPTVAIAILAFGVICFAVALWYDMKDPHRVSRYSATAFWLHLLAAPALVNTLVLSNYQIGGLGGTALAIAALVVFTLLAIIIDRRSFLTAGLIYIGLILAEAISDTGTEWATVLTLLVLGIAVTGLGAFWTQMRAQIMGALPEFPGKNRFPPYSKGLAFSE